jgi:hypothetical protein
MISRRGILGILAAGFAPAVIGSNILMPVRRIIPVLGRYPLHHHPTYFGSYNMKTGEILSPARFWVPNPANVFFEDGSETIHYTPLPQKNTRRSG